MKKHLDRKEGSVLITTMAFAIVLATIAGSVLSLVSHEYNMSKRSVVWNQAIFSAEAGVEKGWNEVNKMTAINTNGSFMSGWTYLGSNQWSLSNQTLTPLAGGDGNSTFSVNVRTNYPQTGYVMITSTGSKTNLLTGNLINRNLQVQLKPVTPFSMAMLAKGLVDFNGNAAVMDSYNSSSGNWSSGTRRAHGTVGTNGSLIDAAGLDIYGSAQTGPGGVVTTSPGFNQYQPVSPDTGTNTISDGLKVSIPDVKLPWTAGSAITPPTVSGQATLNTSTYSDVTIGSVSTKLTITGSGTMRVYVAGSVTLAGNDAITITPSPSGSSLKVEIYVRDSISLLGNGIVNPSQKPTDFFLYGLPTCSSVTVGGTASFTGAIYAPNADLTLNGGALVYGSVVANSIRAVGTIDFHYDEALQTAGNVTSYSLSYWKEY